MTVGLDGKVGKPTLRVVGPPGISSRRALIEHHRALQEDGGEARVWKATPIVVEAPFLVFPARPTEEKGEPHAFTARPEVFRARFADEKGGPLTLPSSLPDGGASFIVGEGEVITRIGRLPSGEAVYPADPVV